MPRLLPQIIAHIRAVAANPAIDTTLIQTEDLEALCTAAESSDAAALGYAQRLATVLPAVITDDMIRRACNAHGNSSGVCEFDWMRDALTAAAAPATNSENPA